MNETLKTAAKNILKDLLSECSEVQHLVFKRMYSPKQTELPINEVVDKMDENKLDWAITQCENTIKKVKNGNK